MNQVLAGATIMLMLWVAACGSDGSSGEQGAETVGRVFTADPTPTFMVPATATPVDFTKECGPPLTEQYCAVSYRLPPPSCPVSQAARITGGYLGTGGPLVWMVQAPVAPFGAGVVDSGASKTVWIVSGTVSGEVKLSGKRLDGPDRMVFPLYDRDPNFYDQYGAGTYEMRWDRTELVLIPPHESGLHRTEIFYPSAGCWQFTAEIGTEQVQIVLYLFE